MREAAGLGGGVKDFELVPIHLMFPCAASLRPALLSVPGEAEPQPTSAVARFSDSAALCDPLAARKRSASSAAMQPMPAAVTAWR